MGQSIAMNKEALFRRIAACGLAFTLIGVGGCPVPNSTEATLTSGENGVTSVDADADADGDGVADAVDICPGFDDTQDDNGDGIPNGCDVVTSFMRTDLELFAVFADSLDPIDLSDLRVGDEVELAVPDEGTLARTLQQQEEPVCSCAWSVQPQSAGLFGTTTQCTTIFTVEEIGDAVIAVVQTCGGVAREFFNGLHAEVTGEIEIAAVDPQAVVTLPVDPDCPGNTICVFEDEPVALNGSDSTGLAQLGFQWEQISGPRVPLLDPQSPDGGCCNPTAVADSETPCTEPGICRLETVQFVAPEASTEAQVSLQFRLTVSDDQTPGISLTHSTLVTVQVTPCPVASAVVDSDSVSAGADVTLTGSHSTDIADVDIRWRQTAGRAISLVDPTGLIAGCCDPTSAPDGATSCVNDDICRLEAVAFIAPSITSTQEFEFEFEVSAGACRRTASVSVTVSPTQLPGVGGVGGGGNNNPCAGVVCDDSDPCTADTCSSGICFFSAISCDDGNVCTADSCDPASGCTHVPLVGVSCDDGIFCNGTESCDLGGNCLSSGDPCAPQQCFEDIDECETCTLVEDCPLTDPTNPCTGNRDACVAGECIYANRPLGTNCDDGNQCTENTECNGAGVCTNGTVVVCNDLDACNGLETCDAASGCQPGTPLNCDDSIACTADSCNAATGCVNVPNDAICDNGLFCDGVELCVPGSGCQDSADPCSGATPACDEASATCFECLDSGDCGPGEFCDLSTTSCQPGTPVSGFIRRGDDDPGVTVGTAATGRALTISILDAGDNPLSPPVSDTTSDGAFALAIPPGAFSAGVFTGKITATGTDVRFEADIDIVNLSQAGSLTNQVIIAFYDFYVDDPADLEEPLDAAQPVGTRANPSPTIQDAVDNMLAGDIARVRAGTYFAEDGDYSTRIMTVSVSGTATRPLRFQNFGNEIVILDAEGVKSSTENGHQKAILVREGSDHVHILGWVIKNAFKEGIDVRGDFGLFEDLIFDKCGLNESSGQASALWLNRSKFSIVRRCALKNGYAGVIASLSEDCLVEDCLSFDHTVFPGNADGFTSKKTAPGNFRLTFRRCIAYGNSDDAFDLTEFNESLMEDCIGFGQVGVPGAPGGAAGNGFKPRKNARRSIIRRTLSFDNDGFGMATGDSSTVDVTFFNNVCYGNGASGFSYGGTRSTAKNDAAMNNTGAGDLKTGSCIDCDQDFNCYEDGSRMGSPMDDNSIFVDPGFVAPDNPIDTSWQGGFSEDDVRGIMPTLNNIKAQVEANFALRVAFQCSVTSAACDPADPTACDSGNDGACAQSAAIDAGSFATFTSAAGAPTTVIAVVDDPRNRFRLGDVIQIEDATGGTDPGRAMIVAMTDTAITLAEALTFDSGKGVHLPWSGLRPDIGAYESP